MMLFTQFNKAARRTYLLVALACCTFPSAQHLNANTPSTELVTIIGHRGSGLAPTSGTKLIGNTFNAIQQGIDHGADWIEIDIRQSKDGALMIFHDATVDRTTNQTGALDTFTKDDLQALKIKVDPAETILTLEAVFKRFAPQGIRFILDIKVHGIRAELQRLIKQHLQHDQIILFGDYSILTEYIGFPFRRGYTALYSEGSNRYRFWLSHSFLLERCKKLGCDTLVLPQVFLKKSLIQSATTTGITVWSYGNDTPKAWSKAINQRVTGLIVDDVERVIQHRAKSR